MSLKPGKHHVSSKHVIDLMVFIVLLGPHAGAVSVSADI